MKKSSVTLLFLLSFTVMGLAQQIISGTVTDTLGQPLIGANVVVKGSSYGTFTDQKGYYQFTVPANAEELLFSYLGFVTRGVEIGTARVIDVQLREGVLLETAIVTALGIKRSEKSLPYAVQRVSKEDLNITRQSSLTDALAGKVAGVQVVSTSAMRLDRDATARIRGVGSLGGPGTILYIVDGTPTTNLPSMDDIESVTVLKGPSATALYGQRGDRGAIVITTKQATKSKGIGIEINQNTFLDRLYLLPKYQDLYAGGASSELIEFKWRNGMPEEWKVLEGKYYHDYSDDTSWGPRMEGQEYIPWYAWYPDSEFFGVTEELLPQPDNVRDFYETGVTLYNNINFQKADQDYSLRVSFTNQNVKGMIPTTGQDKYSLSTAASIDLGEKFKLGANINYITDRVEGNFSEGWPANQTNSSFNQWFHRNLDMKMVKRLRNLRSPEGILASWNHLNPNVYLFNPSYFYSGNFWYNFYSALDHQENINNTKSLNGNLNLTYYLSGNFFVQAFLRRDQWNRDYENKTYYVLEQSALQNGVFNSYSTGFNSAIEDNYEILVTFRERLGANFSLEANAGGNVRVNTYKSLSGATSQGLNVPDLFTVANSKVQTSPSEFRSLKKIRSLYARGSFGYKEMIYLDWSGRNDWSSALPENNNSYFYPSVGMSFVFSELTAGKLPFLSYGKLRASWAQVGSDLDAYALDLNYSVQPNQWKGNFLMTTPNTLVDPGIEPSLSSAYEVGLDLRFFIDRLGLSVTYYSENKINEILSVPITSASGFRTMNINAGRIDRRGLEFQLYATPVKGRHFRWDLRANLGTTENEVVKLTDDVDKQVSGSEWLAVVHEVGGQWGQIRGGGIKRDEQGRPILTADGFYQTEVDTYFGNFLPHYTGGVLNTLSYQNLTLGFNVDFSVGGVFYSLTDDTGVFTGLLARTAAVNDQGKNVRDPISEGGGVRVDGVDATGDPKTVYVPAFDYYQQFSFNRIAEPFIQDRTYVKLREASLGYQLPLRKLGLANQIQGAHIAIVARNPWLIYAKNRDLDPSESPSFEEAQFPSVRSFGVNLKLNF